MVMAFLLILSRFNNTFFRRMTGNNKKWWSLSRNESYGLVAILVLILVGAAVLYVVRKSPVAPVPKSQTDKARAFVAALDSVSIDYDKPGTSRRHHHEKKEKGGRTKVKHGKASGRGQKSASSGGGSDLRPVDRIEN